MKTVRTHSDRVPTGPHTRAPTGNASACRPWSRDAWRCGESLDAALPRVSEDHAAVDVLMKAANSPHSPRKRWDAQAGRTRPGDSRSQGAGQDAGSGSRAARGVGSPAGSGRAHRGAGRGGRAARPSTAAARRSHTAGEERNAAARHRRRHTGSRRRAGSREPESREQMPCARRVHAAYMPSRVHNRMHHLCATACTTSWALARAPSGTLV